MILPTSVKIAWQLVSRQLRKELPMAGFYIGTKHEAEMASERKQIHNAATRLRRRGYLITTRSGRQSVHSAR